MRVASKIRRKKRNKISWGRRRTKDKNKLVAALDAECRERIMQRDKVCQRCGTDKDLQWSHVMTRGIMSLRWDEQNSKVLCRACHCWWTNFPIEAAEWFRSKFPERLDYLLRVRAMNLDFGYTQIAALHEQTFGQAGAR